MASNQFFDSSGFFIGSSLVGAKEFLESRGAHLGSAFGTSTPRYIGGREYKIKSAMVGMIRLLADEIWWQKKKSSQFIR